MAACNDKNPPAFNRSTDEYSKWKKKFNVWKNITDLEKKKTRWLFAIEVG